MATAADAEQPVGADRLIVGAGEARARREIMRARAVQDTSAVGRSTGALCAAETFVPTVIRIGPYRLFFYSADCGEPQHVHVARDDAVAKYWLDPVQYDHSLGFRPAELRKIQRIVSERRTELLEAWNEFFGQ